MKIILLKIMDIVNGYKIFDEYYKFNYEGNSSMNFQTSLLEQL
jgi:hypothetical protein